jgi:threonine dehydrogenase-like Zn-dependent dehydrogenase
MPERLAFSGPYAVERVAYDDPPLGPRQVLVRTEWASGKHGTTAALFDSGVFKGQRFDQDTRLFLPDDRPTVPDDFGKVGTSGVGTVAAIGSAVTRWRPGDRVFGRMDIAETNIGDEDKIWLLGDIDPMLALCIEPAYVSFHCIRESGLRYGDTVVVIGLGALGLLAVAMARAAGADRIFAVDPLPGRRKLALAYGAEAAFDPRADDAPLLIHQATGGAGVDVAIELSGVTSGLQDAIRSCRIAGTICSAGFYQRDAQGLWLGREWHHNRLTMVVPHGCGWGHPPRDFPRWDAGRAHDAIVSLMRQGKLQAMGLIDPVVGFGDVSEVYRLIRDEPHRVVKYAVRFQ